MYFTDDGPVFIRHSINLTDIAKSLSKGKYTYTIVDIFELVRQALDTIGNLLGRSINEYKPDVRKRKNSIYLYVTATDFVEGLWIEGRLEGELKKTVEILERGVNGANEFLKLNSNPNYYRIDLFGLITFCKWRLPDANDNDFEFICKNTCEHLESFGLKAIWGRGCARYDKGTKFEPNGGYYLFFEIPNNLDGKNIEQALFKLYKYHTGP